MPPTLDYQTPDDPEVGGPRWGRRRSWPLLLACLYLPYVWILFVDYPWAWSRRRIGTLVLSPILPGLPASLAVKWSDAVLIPMMTVVTAAILAAVLLPFRRARSKVYVIRAACVVLILSILNAAFVYALYRR